MEFCDFLDSVALRLSAFKGVEYSKTPTLDDCAARECVTQHGVLLLSQTGMIHWLIVYHASFSKFQVALSLASFHGLKKQRAL
jgi:hypothetical protein